MRLFGKNETSWISFYNSTTHAGLSQIVHRTQHDAVFFKRNLRFYFQGGQRRTKLIRRT